MNTYTASYSDTFTVTHARHIAAKVGADLKRMQRFYGFPSDSAIDLYELEIVQLLKGGYLEKVIYGFKRDGQWIEPTLIYRADELSSDASDDDPGRIRPGANTDGATFYSYLTYGSKWHLLPSEEKRRLEQTLPLNRTSADEPGINGREQSNDKTYSAGGHALRRSTVRAWQ